MADKEFTNKEAHKLIQDHGKEIGQLPGGREAMGFDKDGPMKEGLACQAQKHLGNVDKSNRFAEEQRNAMKK